MKLRFFEFEDQPWFPHILRRYLQDILEFIGTLDPTSYSAFVKRLRARMAECRETRIVDLCSGGAGPVRSILRLMQEREYPVTAILTDLFPNQDAFEKARRLSKGKIDFVPEPVDATRVPAQLEGFRLLCNSFHHFGPATARAILADAVSQKRGIAVVEVVDLSVASLIGLFLGGVISILATPFIKPFRWSRLFLTYLLPLVPLLVLFDGVVSCFRVYKVKELSRLIEGLDPGYQWEMGRLPIPKTPMKFTYLIGAPGAGG